MNNERLLDLLRSRTGEAMIQASDVTRNLPSADEVLRWGSHLQGAVGNGADDRQALRWTWSDCRRDGPGFEAVRGG